MAASTEQKVDFLLKKIGYTASKTGSVSGTGAVSGTSKQPFGEAIPSPLVVPSTSVWADSSLIPSTPPTTSTFPVGVNTTGSAYQLTHDATASGSSLYRSFVARSTHGNQTASIDGNWIDSQFGADYAVRVFVGAATNSSNEIPQAGTSSDAWFFDYSSGVLNFNDTNLPAGITTTNVYLVGYRYTGGIGVKPPIGVGTFSSLNVTGIATFNDDVNFIGAAHNAQWDKSANSLKFAGNAHAVFGTTNLLELRGDWNTGSSILNSSGTLYLDSVNNVRLRTGTNKNALNAIAGGAVELYYGSTPDKRLETLERGVGIGGSIHIDNDLYVTGISTLTDDVRAGANLSVAGLSTFTQLVDINGGGQANTFKVEDLTAGRVTYAGTGGELQDSGNLTFDGTDLTAASAKISDLTDNRVVLAGTSGALEDSGNLTFDANSNLNITGGLVVSGITTLGSVGISTGLISGPATMYIDPATVGDNTGLLVVKGNLQVDGTQTTVNSATMTVTDKNIEIAKGAANDAAADGAGITIDSGDGDKTLNWVDATDAWTSSEHIQVAAGKQLGFADDPNTYIDRPAADTIRFTAGGSERVRIQTDGNTKITGALNVTGITTSARLNVTGITTVATLNVGVSGQTLVGITTILDEDSFASNSAAALATQQSIKAYVDTQITAQDLDVTDGTTAISIDLDSETLSVLGTANEVTSVASGNSVTLGLPDDVTIANDLTVASNAGIGSLSVAGVSTFNGNVGFATDITWGGGSYTSNTPLTFEQDNNIGVSTFLFQSRGSNQPEFTFSNLHNGNWGTGYNNGVQYHKFIWEAPNEVGIATVDNGYLVNRRIAALQEIATATGGGDPAFQFRVNDGTSTLVRAWTANHSSQTWRVDDAAIFSINSTDFEIKNGVDFTALGHVTFGNTINDNIIFTGRVNSNIIPKTNNDYDLGSSGRNWLTVHSKQLSITGITTTVQLKVGANPTVGITTILDEDNMASDSATALATQQSIKAYVDTTVTAQDLDIAGDSGTGAVDLDSQSLTIAGTSNEIETSASGQTLTVGLPDNVTIGNDLTVTGNIDANGNLDVDGQTEVDDINVAGVSTFVGVATFTSNHVYIDNKLFVGGIEISPGAAITTPNLDINDYIRHNGDLTTKFGFPTDGKVVTNISGTERISITAAGTYTTGIATATGVINSQTDVQINGTSVLTSALDEAVAMAIALG